MKLCRLLHRVYLILLLIGVQCGSLVGQSAGEEWGKSNPYETFYGFLHFLQPESYQPDRAAQFLKINGTPAQRREVAIQLKAVLDGGGYYVTLGRLPRDADYVDEYTGQHIYFPFHERRPEIYLEKYGSDWLISAETVRATPKLYKQTFPLGLANLIDKLPESLLVPFWGMPIWKWLAIPTLLLLVVAFYYLFVLILFFILLFIGNNYIRHLKGETALKKRIANMVSIWLTIHVALVFLPGLMLPVRLMNWLISTLVIFKTLMLIFVVLRIADVVFLYAKDYVSKTTSKMDDQLLPIFTRIIQAIIIIGGILNILQALDVNVTALIAGVSIGGLALALAAQDTVKNLIGSAMIFLDKPFQIGDYVIGAGYEGTIEEVGFRTTRLRNVDKSVISVPNGNVANDTITNLGLRPARRLQMTIGLLYSTPPDTLEKYVQGLRQLIDAHPKTSKTDYLIRFHTLGASSLDIFFRVYLFAPSIADELAIREDILLGVVRLAGEVGVNFAYPSTSIYIEQSGPSVDADSVGTQEALDEKIAQYIAQFQAQSNEKFPDTPPAE